MARITWKGEGASPPPTLEWRGVTFPLGQAVEVDDPAIIAKAKTAISIFKVEEDGPVKAGGPPQPEPAPKPAPAPAPAPDDNDDGDEDDEEEEKPHRAVPRRHATQLATRKKK